MYSPVGLRVTDVGAVENRIQSTHVAVGTSQTRIVLSKLAVSRRRPLGLNDKSVMGPVWRGEGGAGGKDRDGVGALSGRPKRLTILSASQSNTRTE